MQTWAILAAKHAALTSGIGLGAIPPAGWESLDGVAVGLLLASVGFAAVSGRRLHGCPLPPVGAQAAAAGGGNQATARASKIRRRVDGLLTGMLSDDADKLAPAAGALGGRVPSRSAGRRVRWSVRRRDSSAPELALAVLAACQRAARRHRAGQRAVAMADPDGGGRRRATLAARRRPAR